jgi:hypothetical protein
MGHLPQSESDSTIRNAVQAMYTQIELHVDNYYRDANVKMTPELQHELMKVDSKHLPDSVAGLLPHTRTPTVLIKHCLAQLIISHISLEDKDAKDSFLPTDFTALPATFSTSTTGKPGKSPIPIPVPCGPRAPPTELTAVAFAPAFSLWRVLAAYLRAPPPNDRAYLSQRDKRISTIAEAFNTTFQPWAQLKQPPDARRGHLHEIMKSASETGVLLFTQSSTFRYEWEMPEGRSGGGVGGLRIVVLPGFVKVSNESAKVLDRPQVLIGPTVESLT